MRAIGLLEKALELVARDRFLIFLQNFPARRCSEDTDVVGSANEW